MALIFQLRSTKSTLLIEIETLRICLKQFLGIMQILSDTLIVIL